MSNRSVRRLAAVVLLDINGHETGLDDDGAFDLVMAAAESTAELEEIAQRLRASTTRR